MWVTVARKQWRDLLISPNGASSPRRDGQGLAQTLLHERLPKREGSRLSEIPCWFLFPFFSPRLGEGDSPEWERLAWARPFSLSKGLDEAVCYLVAWFLLDDWYLLGMIVMMRNIYNGSLCMHDVIHEWWMMDIVGTWHVKWMSGLELKRHGIDMRWGPILMGGNDQWYGFNMWYEWGFIFRCCYGIVIMISILWLLIYDCWSVLVCNSLESLGETSGVALQWSRRNSMAPISGCPWWCPICITR